MLCNCIVKESGRIHQMVLLLKHFRKLFVNGLELKRPAALKH